MRRILLLAALAATACSGARPRQAARVLTGLDALEAEGFSSLKGKRVGVITNRTGADARGRSIVDLLAAAPGVELAAVFTPEHGLFASTEIDPISSGRQWVAAVGRKIPLYNLIPWKPEMRRPSAAQLEGLDVLVFDIQDVGARFYTYAATMAMALEAAKTAGIEFVVLDRPNPIGGTQVEGPAADEVGLTGFEPVSYLPVVTRHGMTVGELARMHNATVGHPRLIVVKMRGWKRGLWYDQTGLPWVPPSPNMPDLAAATLYPGVASLEYANISVGRGTASPFGWIGAPWMRAEDLARTMNASLLEGVQFSAETRVPSKDIYAGTSCPGLKITVTDRDAVRPLRIFTRLAMALRALHPDDFDLNWKVSRKLIGRKLFADLYERGAAPDEIDEFFDRDSAEFVKKRSSYLLYPNE